MNIPKGTKDVEQFIKKVIVKLNSDFNYAVIQFDKFAREDNAYLFASLVEVHGTILLEIAGKIQWRFFYFACHQDIDFITGIDNLVYHNITKKLDLIARQRQ